MSDTRISVLAKEIEHDLRVEYDNDYIVSIDTNPDGSSSIWAKHILCEKDYKITDMSDIKCSCKPMTTAEFREKIFSMTDGEYYLYGDYTNPHTEVTLIHNKCGGAFNVTPNAFICNLQKCPDCSGSWGEHLVRNWLIEHNVAHVKQYRFPDCVYKRTLPFDFYLPILRIAIEYDGEQHFKPVARFGGEAGFKYRQGCDMIKNEYCKTNDIQLIRLDKSSNLNTELQIILDKIASIINITINDDEEFETALHKIQKCII